MGHKLVTLDIANLVGENAFGLLGAFSKAARRQGWTQAEVNVVVNEAIKSDYGSLVKTLEKYTC